MTDAAPALHSPGPVPRSTEPACPHTLTVEIRSQDHTQALLRFASDLHRRRITIDSLRSEQLSPATVGITTRFTATRRAADTVRHTVATRVEVLSADLNRPAVPVAVPTAEPRGSR
ncbi:hypothetical protein [Mycolicibacterium helvum]|uniref:Uncharacterized protein n=1 Tax=Mycolicibacterium helvum TaxID=1534349 RepID=A0A7I7TBZ6_9MYCO|nr:hypothetical protein [Mycolicibacterium helvum]BBY66011.1 hypothetical protein MHEL_42540 [Mycolicibacterium helvum]